MEKYTKKRRNWDDSLGSGFGDPVNGGLLSEIWNAIGNEMQV